MAEPIAIVGSACRFPGSASSPSKLWDLLKAPRDVLRDFPSERLNFSNFYNRDGEHHGRTDVQGKSYLLEEDCRLFDTLFFRINPKEAHGMDPQQRILLETVYESFEAAGWTLDSLEGSSTSVHVGCMTADYNDIQMRDLETLLTYTSTGLARSILANRISYFFDLRGSSMTIDTACSSSLVALHQAVQGLRNGDATQAVVAGITLILDPAVYIAESKLHMLSPDSRSRMWDSRANGYARGEGCASILLKPLSKALLDNDHIECIIREIGVNSDGRTNGITVPSSKAQTKLIRQTYINAGLDPTADRCQFFECHGTGTLVGDPVEAQGIQEAFFPDQNYSLEGSPLYCGSVKTVIGHLEGCAGLAGVLKASLAIQNKEIPPNMHFEELNSAIEPYYDNLSVPTTKLPWPDTHGKPLRASVNSFGFGGTNSHVILESYEPTSSYVKNFLESSGLPTATKSESACSVAATCLPGPFIFSAKSRSSLLRTLQQTLKYLESNPSLDLDVFSWVLQSRKTAFSNRLSISASSRKELIASLEKHISATVSSSNSLLGVRAATLEPKKPPKLLGVFTGQGAQWPTMGRKLLEANSMFRKSLESCENALKNLPDPPSWSLIEELTAEADVSRISQAQFSQPLSTAVQVALIDLLRAVGINFSALLGHSSGETAAAYAAGIINAKDAMGIAYYRGFVAHLAGGREGQSGGMMAVGISFDEANTFCSKKQFKGRVGVAASNSPSSVTLSGDADAIKEAKVYFDEEKIFARMLSVDKAYHSHHMLPCADSYLGFLKKLDIQVKQPRINCTWSSSVRQNVNLNTESLDPFKGQYWVDNMVKPVLFSQALDFHLQLESDYIAALEVGPHPALKGPVSQTAKSTNNLSIPYFGCFDRKMNDVDAFSSAIGSLWSYLGPNYVDFNAWRSAFDLSNQNSMIPGLPSYPWDHDQVYWRESRLSHNYRLGNNQPHELLGHLHEDVEYEMTWRNVLCLSELPWLRGHTFQGQVLFPGVGYASMAVQAAQSFVRDRPIRLIEIRDMNIHKAVAIDEDSAGVEIVFTVRSQELPSTCKDNSVLEAEFTCYCCADERLLDKSCDGRLLIHLGTPSAEALPPKNISQSELPPLNVDRFYKAAEGLGIVYDGVFRTFSSINRIQGHSKAAAIWSEGALGTQYILHPAILDVSCQAGFAAFVSIADKAMGSTFLPASFRSIIVDPAHDYSMPTGESHIEIEASVLQSNKDTVEVELSLGSKSKGTSGVQINGFVLKAITEPQPADDRLLFAKTVWDVDSTAGLPVPEPREITKDELDYIDAVERTALFYMQRLSKKTDPIEVSKFKWYHQALFKAIQEFIKPIREGNHPVLEREWLEDTREQIEEFAGRYPESVDLAMLTAVWEGLPSVLRGETEMLEHMLKNDLLSRIYTEGRGLGASNVEAAAFMRKISHKYPKSKILEIGAGTGGTTGKVFDAIGDSYSSYTYTDISAGFFEKAAEKFADHAYKMKFKVFNAEKPPTDQGFAEGSFDIIIAANVFHATRDLAQTMRHTRALLRPGGYLVAVEVTGSMLREPGLMGGLEGWWLGADDGRFPRAGISAKEWHDVLLATGFSGVDSIVYDMPDIKRHNCSVFVTQAIDQQFDLLRDPLASIDLVPKSKLLIVGGESLPVLKAVRQAERLLKKYTTDITVCASIDTLELSEIEPGATVLCLSELDRALFADEMLAARLENLQELLSSASNVLWVTNGRLSEDPYSNMMVGIGRSLAFEMPHVGIQFLNFDGPSSWDMEMAVQYLLRMVLLSSPQYRNHNILWVQEPEVEIKGDMTLIPRVILDDDANEGLNASRRRITKLAKRDERIEVVYGDSQSNLTRSAQTVAGAKHVSIAVELSTALHQGKEQPCYLCFGHLQESGRHAIVLTETDSSTAIVDSENVFEPPASFVPDAKALTAVGSLVIASQILSSSPPRGTLLIHEPNEQIAEATKQVAADQGRKVLFITANQEAERPGWISIHPLAQIRVVRRLLPSDASCLLTFSKISTDNIWSCLSSDCIGMSLNPSVISRHKNTISEAYQKVPSISIGEVPRIVNIYDIPNVAPTVGRMSKILDWKRSEPLSVTVPPIRVQDLFSSDKTYFMVGMTGELGQSLCRFMVSHGARHVVLASRNPVSDANWLADMRLVGANVRVVKMDVTDRNQVKETAAMIRSSMPALGGVANAAMVLDDTLFVNATADIVAKQLKPKVNGTSYLNEEFKSDTLDFFVAFSSLGSIYGSAGQSIYHAANMFMTSLVEKRRSHGLAGSVINIGMIVDLGYVARSERSGTNIEENLSSQFYVPLAESEFHHLFVQGIISGRPGSTNADVTMGIQPFVDDPNATVKPNWYENPYLSHMIFHPKSSASSSQSNTSVQQIRERLDTAESIDLATDAFQELFCLKIESMIKVPASSIDTSAPLSDLGLDSLLAVEIRTWLVKEMHVDNIPILQILGSDPLSTICSDAAQKLLEGRGSKGEQDLKSPAPTTLTIPQSENVAVAVAESVSSSSESPPPVKTGDPYSSASDIQTPTGSVTTSIHKIKDGIADHEANFSASELENSSFSLPELNDQTTSWSGAQSGISAFKVPDLDEVVVPLEYRQVERLSYAQSSMYFLHNFLDDPTTFNVTAHYDIQGALKVNRFSRALSKVLAHHEAYQTCFFSEPGSLEPKQAVMSSPASDRFIHFNSVEAEDIENTFRTMKTRDWKLASGQTFQAVLISHHPGSHTVIFGVHHIVQDGFSWDIFLADLDRAYQLLPLESAVNSYLDFSRSQLADLEAGKIDSSIQYWLNELKPVPNVLPLLPFSKTRSRQPRRAYGNHIVQRKLTSEQVQQVKAASQACGSTPMQFYLTVVQTLFACLLDLEDICIGVTDTGRGDGDYSDTVGHFTNLLPMRLRANKTEPFSDLVRKTSATILRGQSHSQVPFDVILGRLELQRTSGYTPLFQLIFNYRVGDLLQRNLGNCTMELIKYVDTKMPYDFAFNVTQAAKGGHFLEVLSNDSLYTSAATEFIMDTFIRLLESLSHDQSTRLDDCKLYSEQQVQKALDLGRGPQVKYQWPSTLTERFDQVHAKFPESIAIKDEHSSMTYDQLSRRVDSIVSELVRSGANIGTRVAVLCEPSIDTYATMLGVLRAGAVYVPLDVSLPASRHQAMLASCEPELLVFHTATSEAALQLTGRGSLTVLNLSDISESTQGSSLATATADSFLLFTSGSTGSPKGIRLSQSGIINYAASKSAKLGLEQIKVLQQSSTGFDMSVAQAFNAFANGGTLVIAPAKARGDPAMIAQLILEEEIEFTICTPSEYHMLATYASDILRRCKPWRHACSGGEAIGTNLLFELQKLELPDLSLLDCYGPTEISCAGTFKEIPLRADGENHTASRSVGQAIPNTSVYIVDSTGEALPVGFLGEVCIGGQGVANGYLDKNLSSTKFIANPFATAGDVSRGWTMLYRTGDRGCLQEDGSLVFLGRIDEDSQVKLRGLRIELDEVANAICRTAQGSIVDAVVTVRGEPEFLVAHVVPAEGETISDSKLTALLADLPLPRYMVPSMMISVTRLPTSSNGKIDRKAVRLLPLPQQNSDDSDTEPLTVAEGELRLIWREVLGEAAEYFNIRANSDFFTVGGNSLLLVRLQNALKERMGVQISLKDLYQSSTLSKMAATTSKERSGAVTELIDWATETTIPHHMLGAQPPPVSASPRKHRRQILLTGATGFLGSEILALLVNDADIEKIHCIAVPVDAQHKLLSNKKIVAYSGSLLSPTLGLTATDLAFFRVNIDQIIHAGAQGHCLNNYTSVKSANYLSTQFLAELALPRHIPLHFISSARVILQSGTHASPPLSIIAHPPPTDGSEGFTASKWASEAFLENLSKHTNLPVTIHRHCSIIGSSAPHDDAMNSVIHYSLLSRSVPSVPAAEGYFDFKDVGEVADEIVRGSVAESGIKFRHHSSGVKVRWSELAQRMEEIHGHSFDVVSMQDWIRKAIDLGIEDLIVSYLEANVAGAAKLSFPYLGMPEA